MSAARKSWHLWAPLPDKKKLLGVYLGVSEKHYSVFLIQFNYII